MQDADVCMSSIHKMSRLPVVVREEEKISGGNLGAKPEYIRKICCICQAPTGSGSTRALCYQTQNFSTVKSMLAGTGFESLAGVFFCTKMLSIKSICTSVTLSVSCDLAISVRRCNEGVVQHGFNTKFPSLGVLFSR